MRAAAHRALTGDGLTAWSVCLPTVLETRIRLASPRVAEAGPWPLSRALAELAPLGVQATERFRALGAGRGRPLIHSQAASWRGLTIELEAVSPRGATGVDEVSMALPSHEEMTAAGAVEEGAFWELVDTLAAAVDAGHGAIVDGEAMSLDRPAGGAEWRRRFARHFGLLVPDDAIAGWPPAAEPYRRLQRSGMVVMLR